MKLLVTNLPASLTELSLRALFEQYGPVTSVEMPRDPRSGRMTGNAIVEMPDRAQGRMAVARLHNRPLPGHLLRLLKISEWDGPTGKRPASRKKAA